MVRSVVSGQQESSSDPARESLALAQQNDSELGTIVRLRLTHDEAPPLEVVASESELTKTLHVQWYRLVVQNGVVYRTSFSRTGEPARLQLLAPKTMRSEILQQCHAGVTGGHLGIKRTCDQVQRRAYWPKWRKDTVKFCKTCQNCNTYYRGKLPRAGALQPVLASAPFERLCIDLSGPHVRTPRGSVYILACIDVFTKWVEAFPIPNKEASVVARVLVEQVFCRYGTPLSLLSDQGNEVDSSIMREVCQLLQIDKLHTSRYKPSTNPTERLNRTINSLIGKVVSERQTDWDLWLPYVMAAIRASRQESTSFTPNYLMMGHEVRAPIDLVLGTGNVPSPSQNTYCDFVENVEERMSQAYEMVRKHLGEAALRNKRRYDLRVRPAEYKVGDLVYYYNPRQYRGRQDKWSRKFSGPFKVIRVPGPVNVEIQKTPLSKALIVHVDKVKPYVCRDEAAESVHDDEHPVVDSDADEYDSSESESRPAVQTADVITFNEDQELRRNRPRRNVRVPARFRE